MRGTQWDASSSSPAPPMIERGNQGVFERVCVSVGVSGGEKRADRRGGRRRARGTPRPPRRRRRRSRTPACAVERRFLHKRSNGGRTAVEQRSNRGRGDAPVAVVSEKAEHGPLQVEALGPALRPRPPGDTIECAFHSARRRRKRGREPREDARAKGAQQKTCLRQDRGDAGADVNERAFFTQGQAAADGADGAHHLGDLLRVSGPRG